MFGDPIGKATAHKTNVPLGIKLHHFLQRPHTCVNSDSHLHWSDADAFGQQINHIVIISHAHGGVSHAKTSQGQGRCQCGLLLIVGAAAHELMQQLILPCAVSREVDVLRTNCASTMPTLPWCGWDRHTSCSHLPATGGKEYGDGGSFWCLSHS